MHIRNGTGQGPEKLGAGKTLTVRLPHIEDLVRHLNLDAQYIAIARRAGKNLWVWRNAHDVQRRRRGLFVPDCRLDKHEADRLLRQLANALASEVES